MSPRAVPSRDHLPWSGPREEKNPAGAVRRSQLVGKQTTISNRNTLAPASFLAESSPRFPHFRRAEPVSRFQRLDGYLCSLCCADQIGPGGLRLPTSVRTATLLQLARKPFSFKNFLLGVQGRGLDKEAFTRYMALYRATSRCDSSAEIANGSVPGLLMIGREG